jgi:hypothetical protein
MAVSLNFLLLINTIGLVGYVLFCIGSLLYLEQILNENNYEKKIYLGKTAFYKERKYYEVSEWKIRKKDIILQFKLLN